MTNQKKTIYLLSSIGFIVTVWFVFLKKQNLVNTQNSTQSNVGSQAPEKTSKTLQSNQPQTSQNQGNKNLHAFTPVQNLDQLQALYGGLSWVIRKDTDGKLKRILGMDIQLGSTDTTRVGEFIKSAARALGIKSGGLVFNPFVLPLSPTVTDKSETRIFRFKQVLGPYAVIDGYINAYIDPSTDRLTGIETSQYYDIKSTLDWSKVKPKNVDQIKIIAEQSMSLKLLTSSTTPSIFVRPSGEPKLVYQFTSNSDGGPSAQSRTVFIDAQTGKKVSERPLVILN